MDRSSKVISMRKEILVLLVCLVLPPGCENRSGTPPGDAPKASPPGASPVSGAPAAPAATAKQDTRGAPVEAEPAASAPSGAGAAAPVQPPSAPGATVKTPSGLEYEVLKEGEGPSPPLGSRVTVHFTGFVDGKKLRDTREDGVPREFKLDSWNLIDGWVETLLTMKKGERRKIKVPSRLAYGSAGYSGVVPREKDITFDLELVSFLPPGGTSSSPLSPRVPGR
jgi:FKBP-type peptidyl-prolyl cis-trans isomerase